MTGSAALQRIRSADLCAGCGACAGTIAPDSIRMTETAEGYLRPEQIAPLTPAQETRLAQTCPGLTLTLETQGRESHVLWGPHLAVRTGHAADPALRRHASSGGALSALLTHLIESGTVERVIQVAADEAVPIANATVESLTAADIAAAAGSRYAPSAPLDRLEAVMAGDGRAAFVGKPCDVAALRMLARTDDRIDACFPYMISFFCAGVPSLAGVRRVLTALDVPEHTVTRFRYRGDGWPGFATATTTDGRQARMSYADSWGGILSKHLQFRCKICPDGVGSFADVVCADAWECDEAGYPLFEERDGVSLIVSRTARGEALVSEAEAAGRIVAQPLAVGAIGPMQPGQSSRKRLSASRLAALAVTGRPVPRFRGLRLLEAAREGGIAANLRSFLGTCRRLLRQVAPR